MPSLHRPCVSLAGLSLWCVLVAVLALATLYLPLASAIALRTTERDRVQGKHQLLQAQQQQHQQQQQQVPAPDWPKAFPAGKGPFWELTEYPFSNPYYAPLLDPAVASNSNPNPMDQMAEVYGGNMPYTPYQRFDIQPPATYPGQMPLVANTPPMNAQVPISANLASLSYSAESPPYVGPPDPNLPPPPDPMLGRFNPILGNLPGNTPYWAPPQKYEAPKATK